jgi:hypothetical protein
VQNQPRSSHGAALGEAPGRLGFLEAGAVTPLLDNRHEPSVEPEES